jgi:nucleoside-diphosphate-sugar epimerase
MTLPILVTGGTGRLGRQPVRRLVAAGCGIRMLTRHGRQAADGIQFLTGDLHTGEGWTRPRWRRPTAVRRDEHGEARAAAVGGSE